MIAMQHDRTDRPDTDPRTGPHTPRPAGGTGAAAAEERPVDLRQAVLDGMGGPWGMVYSTLPVVGFAAAVPFTTLTVAIAVALAAAVALGVFRMWRGEAFMSAMGGVFGVAAAGGVSAWTGSADDFFLIGIWASLAGAVLVLATLVVRRPLTGVIWNALHGGAHDWRGDAPSRFAHDLATGTVLAVLAGRFIVRQWLYLSGSTTGLAIADTLTGFPLTALAALVVVWAFRRTTKRLTPAAPSPSAGA
ncbi:DUF3159 domain-containing protein [Nocardiopsis trehalosi]|jgi:hypothetical protein|uniref:DUF3159 domain-containing protein n=1 Tax=Nocardiopsis trehalosi TaxID=109329 RepID=UPI000B1467D7|nr:DUF3159 domain-containing protein [Nocardiopsis trehalosi]